MLVAEILLFRANRAAVLAQTDLQAAQVQLRGMEKELADLRNSTAGLQVTEIARLRKQNDLLTEKNAALSQAAEESRAQNQQTAQHLTTARTALQLQQDHLRELATENQEVRAVAQQLDVEAARNACLNNLRQIDAAKNQWALENNKLATDLPTAANLLPYFPGQIFPVCPAGGIYTIGTAGEVPGCSVPGHQLP